MISMSKVESIRKMRREGNTIAEISRNTEVSEPTIRKYLAQDDLSPKLKPKKQVPSKLDPYKTIIDNWLEEDRQNWRKQRHTAVRIQERLKDEYDAEFEYSMIQRYVKEARGANKSTSEQFLDLVWAPAEAQVDFGQADFYEYGVRRRLHYLVVDFPFSNVGLSQVFYGENAECVCAGLIAIFNYIGGVPRKLVFDNATGVGRKICSVLRTTELFSAFAAHYGFDYVFCNPASGHEKGAVENKVGAIRRKLFVPPPQFDNITLFNRRLLDNSMALSDKDHYLKGESERALFFEDAFALLGLPEKEFSPITYKRRKTDKYGRICLNGRHWYSTDPVYGSVEVIVALSAFDVSVFDVQGTFICTHKRAYGDKPTDTNDPASQLALLCRKPGGWQNSQVRATFSDDLRDFMDASTRDDLKGYLRTLRDESECKGYQVALAAMESSYTNTGTLATANISVLAEKLSEGNIVIDYDEAVNLAEYDKVFIRAGGGHDE